MDPKDQTRRVDWAELNPKDQTWKFAAPSRQPWIFKRRIKDNPKLEFCCISSNKTHIIPLPETHLNKNQLGGTPNGYIMTFLDGGLGPDHLIFVNPITGDEILLPSEGGRCGCILGPAFIWNKTTEFNKLIFSCVRCVRKNGKFIFISFLYIWQDEIKKWSKIKIPHSSTIAYWRGKFYTYYFRSKNVVVIDESTGDILSTIPQPEKVGYKVGYLISTPDCVLLVTVRVVDPYNNSFRLDDFQFEVCCLDNYEENPHWTQLSGIGDLVIFLDERDNGFSLLATDLDGFRGNCIYFVDRVLNRGSENFAVCRFDMREKKTEIMPLPVGFDEEAGSMCWFVPTL